MWNGLPHATIQSWSSSETPIPSQSASKLESPEILVNVQMPKLIRLNQIPWELECGICIFTRLPKGCNHGKSWESCFSTFLWSLINHVLFVILSCVKFKLKIIYLHGTETLQITLRLCQWILVRLSLEGSRGEGKTEEGEVTCSFLSAGSCQFYPQWSFFFFLLSRFHTQLGAQLRAWTHKPCLTELPRCPLTTLNPFHLSIKF